MAEADRPCPSCEMGGYWTHPLIRCEDFALPPEGLSDERRAVAYDQLRTYLRDAKASFIGYQSNMGLDFSHLAEFIDLSLNNIGDSFSNPETDHPDGYFTVGCKWMERAVLDYYADLWHAPLPHRTDYDNPHGCDPDWRDTYWGYVLSMGSTEGNLIGLRNARDYLSGVCLRFDQDQAAAAVAAGPAEEAYGHLEFVAPREVENPNAYRPVLLFSNATHYSVAKIAQIIAVEPVKVAVGTDGTVDLDDLQAKAKTALETPGGPRPIIVVFNYGTTFTGGYDDVAGGIARLLPLLAEHGMDSRQVTCPDGPTTTRTGYWFHVDGALGAGYVPYLKRAQEDGEFPKTGAFPDFDFREGIQSVVVSGHKWLGAPAPTGVFMTLNKYQLTTDVPAYVGALDSTLAGSRSGFAALALWDTLARQPEQEHRAAAIEAQDLAEYAAQQLADKLGSGVVHRAPGSLAVVFPRQDRDVIARFALASTADQSHLFVMPHVDRELIDQLVEAVQPSAPTVSAAQAAGDNLRLGW